jgi:hypothetical protein
MLTLSCLDVPVEIPLRWQGPLKPSETEASQRWRLAAEEYVHLLQDACNRLVELQDDDWREDPSVVRRGRQLRAILGIKGSGFE